MAESGTVGAQLTAMMAEIQRFNRSTFSVKPETSEFSLFSLVWPLLPLLPPTPPPLVSELLKGGETCDVCGSTVTPNQQIPCGKCGPDISPRIPAETVARRRKIADGTTPLERLMLDIERQMDQTLNNIESTVQNNDKLSKRLTEIKQAHEGEVSDRDVLKTLNSLIKEKEMRMERVKVLGEKERQLRESLLTAIKWAKTIQKGDSGDENLTSEHLNQAQEKLETVGQTSPTVAQNNAGVSRGPSEDGENQENNVQE